MSLSLSNGLVEFLRNWQNWKAIVWVRWKQGLSDVDDQDKLCLQTDLTSSVSALNQRICSQSGDNKSSCSQWGDNQPLQSTCGKFCPQPIGSHLKKVLTVLLYFSHQGVNHREPWGGFSNCQKTKVQHKCFLGNHHNRQIYMKKITFQRPYPVTLTLCDKQTIWF